MLNIDEAINQTPLRGTAPAECIEDIVMKMESLSSEDAFDVEANHIVADKLLCDALMLLNDSPQVANLITAFNRIKRNYA